MSSVVAVTWGLASVVEAEELLTLARRCGDVTWLHLGELPDAASETASRFGVSAVNHVPGPAISGADTLVAALAQYCRTEQPRLVLLSQTFESRLIAPRLAGRLGSPIVMNALAIDLSGAETRVTASSYGGDTNSVYRMTGPAPHLVAVMPNALQPEPAATPTSPEVEPFDIGLNSAVERIRVVTPARSEGPRLEDAQVIVAGGRGLGNASNFHLIEELAEAVGGMPAASRPLVDDGWTDASRQVGLTGRITRPALYMALGVSGASQHMAGCSAAKTIVAVNRDPDAAIFRYAKYGIVGDCLEIIPELIRAVREG